MKTTIFRIVLSAFCLAVLLPSHNAQAFSTTWDKVLVSGYIACPNIPDDCFRGESITSWSNAEELIGYFEYVWIRASHVNRAKEQEHFGVTADQPNNQVLGFHYPCHSGNWSYSADAWLWYYGPNYTPTVHVSDLESVVHNMPDDWGACPP